MQVWPGHGAGSACGKALGAVPQSTVGYEKRFSWAFQVRDENDFVQSVLAGQPDPPVYFAHMKRVNKEGPDLISTLPAPQHLRPADLEAELATGNVVVDTRSADVSAGGHIPGTLNIPMGAGFVTWAGWLLRYDGPFALIVDDQDAMAATCRRRPLASIQNQRAACWTGFARARLASAVCDRRPVCFRR